MTLICMRSRTSRDVVLYFIYTYVYLKIIIYLCLYGCTICLIIDQACKYYMLGLNN